MRCCPSKSCTDALHSTCLKLHTRCTFLPRCVAPRLSHARRCPSTGCGKVYLNIVQLKTHISSVHDKGEGAFHCQECGKVGRLPAVDTGADLSTNALRW